MKEQQYKVIVLSPEYDHLMFSLLAEGPGPTPIQCTAKMVLLYTGRFIVFSVMTNTYNKKTEGLALMKLFTATGKLKKVFFFTTRDVRCVHHG
jgi:hypothetical protein